MKTLSFLITATLFLACNQSTTRDGQSNSVTHESPDSNSRSTIDNSDTLLVKGPVIVFFMPSDEEVEAITKEDGEYPEAVNDFQYYAGTVIDSLKKASKIRTEVTTQRVITTVLDDGKTYSFKRTDGEGVVGVVFTDGKQKPKISYGVATEVDYWDMINEYYKRYGTD